MTSVSDPMVGHALDGRYEITEKLARGGMATVYKAVDTRLGRIVAVKIMHEGLGDDTDFARKFDREARAAARLSHPNVVSVFDQGHDLGRPYIVMEYIEGTTLRAVIVRDAPLSPLRALDLIDPVLSALAAAHEAGLVHRDIKPENVLISTRGNLKVADFGLAKALSAQTATATQGMLIGTVSYVPPELVMEGTADCRSDVYSTGIVLYEMLTGRKPHTGDSPIQVAYAHVHNDVPPPSEALSSSWRHSREAVPPYLDALVQAATSRERSERPRDARVLQDHLRRARAALLDGVMDDPRLTASVRRPSLDDDERTEVVLPTGGLATDAEATTRTRRRTAAANLTPGSRRRGTQGSRTQGSGTQGSGTQGSGTAWPQTPVSPQDFEHTLPPVGVADEPTPVEVWAAPRPGRTSGQRRPRRWMALLLAMLLMVAIGAGWWFGVGRWTATPVVDGMTTSQVEQAMTAADVQPHFVEQFSENVPLGTVIATTPGSGDRVLRDSTVEVAISRGPERYQVPRLAGLTRADAEKAIADAALALGSVSEAYSETVADGTVVSAGLTQGRSVKRDTPVDLVVSKGKEPIRIADHEGKSAAAAQKALEKAGFKVKVKTEHSKKVDKGDVISQSSKSGTGVRGDTITLTRSLGPVMVTVPNVYKMGINQARSKVSAAGFKVSVRPVDQNYLGLGYVAKASPGFGSKAPQGSAITLYVV